MKKIILIALLLLGVSKTALAERVPMLIGVVRLTGKHALTTPQFEETLNGAIKLMRSASINATVSCVVKMRDSRPDLASTDPSRVSARLSYWRNRVERKPLPCKWDAVLIVAPPVIEDRSFWFTGLAGRICAWKPHQAFSIVSASYRTPQPDRLPTNRYVVGAIAHELTHLAGAYHTSTFDLMNTELLGFFRKKKLWPIPVSEDTRLEVQLCYWFFRVDWQY